MWQDRIVVDPDILVGKPVIKGTRLAVAFIIDLLAEGWPEAELLRSYPGLTHEDVQACLAYASTLSMETAGQTPHHQTVVTAEDRILISRVTNGRPM